MEIKDLPNLIRTNNYYNVSSFIKNYEDTLQKLFKSQNNNNNTTNLLKDDKIFLWEINEEKNKDLFAKFAQFKPDDFELKINTYDKIMITGPYIRNCLINIDNSIKETKEKDKKNKLVIRKEIYLYNCGDEKWNDIVDDIDKYMEKDNEYIYETKDKKICLIKKKYKSCSQILLQHEYIKRIGWQKGSFYVSSMFMIEFQKHKTLLTSNFYDPILNIPYDPLSIYLIEEKNQKNPIKIIEMVDFDELIKLSDKAILKIYNSKTLIELCFDKYVKEKHIILNENLEKMIIYLLNYKFKRDPYFYAKYIKLYEKNEDLYNLICDNRVNIDIDINIDDVNSFECINNNILEYYIKNDMFNEFIDIITSFKIKINKNILSTIITYGSRNVIENMTNLYLQNEQFLDSYSFYYLLIMSENCEIIDFLIDKNIFDVEISVNFIKDIIEYGLSDIFIHLVEKDKSIISSSFGDNKNILHMIKEKNNYAQIINVILNLYPELLNICDKTGETPIIYHMKNKNLKIVEHFLKFEPDLTILDNMGNTCIHYLCKYDEPKLLKNILKKYPELINMPNMKSDYPIIICCKHSNEEMFYIMKNYGADLDVKDEYGNTIYHYICANSLCLNMNIKNVQNYFGSTPKDYCVLSQKYYNFTS